MDSYPLKELARVFPNPGCFAVLENEIMNGQGINLHTLTMELKIYCVTTALSLTEGNIAQASRILGMNRTTLTEFMRTNEIDKTCY